MLGRRGGVHPEQVDKIIQMWDNKYTANNDSVIKNVFSINILVSDAGRLLVENRNYIQYLLYFRPISALPFHEFPFFFFFYIQNKLLNLKWLL